MSRPRRDMAPIFQRLADGWTAKEIADEQGVTQQSLQTGLHRHRKRLKARTLPNALAMMIARGEVIARS